jgi:hypothetical protein
MRKTFSILFCALITCLFISCDFSFVSGAAGDGTPPGSKALAAGLTITNDRFWRDTSGNFIYSQGGGVFKFGSKYYWYGVKYNGAVTYANNPVSKNSDTSFNAVTCYSSTDLVNWKFESNALTASTPGLSGTSWLGRMGVVYNGNTGKYVLITQYGGTAGTGELFATCSTPTGTFAFNNIQYPVPGVANNTTGDQTVFIDTDGKAYLICSSSSGRSNWYVAKIRESDSLAIETATRIGGGTGREGNCMFTYNGRYYFCSSDLHGWNASHVYYISATNITGPYGAEAVMTNTDADFAHVTQTGFFVTIAGTSATTVIYAGDRWSDFAGNGLGYNQWVPLSFNGATPIFNSLSEWRFDITTGAWEVGPGNNYSLNPSFEADRVAMTVPAGWKTWTNLGSAKPFGNSTSGPHTGRWKWQLTYTAAYQASTYQDLTGLPNGSYTLKTWVKSGGGQSVAQVYVKNYGGAEIDYSIKTAIGSWTQISIPNIVVTNGSAQIGVYTSASANKWVNVDDFTFMKN